MKSLSERMSDEELKKRALSTVPHEGAGAIITALQAENEKLREALRFYARENSWRSSGVYACGHSQASSAELDHGAKARAALEPKP